MSLPLVRHLADSLCDEFEKLLEENESLRSQVSCLQGMTECDDHYQNECDDHYQQESYEGHLVSENSFAPLSSSYPSRETDSGRIHSRQTLQESNGSRLEVTPSTDEGSTGKPPPTAEECKNESTERADVPSSSRQERDPPHRSQRIADRIVNKLSTHHGYGTQKQETTDVSTTPYVESVVAGPWFESFFVFLIISNAACMALNAQYLGMDRGHNLTVMGYPNSAEDTWPGVGKVFRELELVFGLFFCIELVVRVAVLRKKYFYCAWNIFDALIVLGWVLAECGVPFIVNPMVLRLLRLVRMGKLVKILKKYEAFDSLRIIMRSISASLPALFWAVFLLFFVEVLVGLFVHSMLGDFIDDPQNLEAAKTKVFLLFGTFSRSMITMTELTFGNFIPVLRTLADEVNEWYGHGILIYKITVGFAVIRVISGVFLYETFKTASSDDELMVVQKKRAQQKHAQKMERLLKEADSSHDGNIQRDEFQNLLKDVTVRTWLAAQEVEVGDAHLLFDLMDDGDHQLTAEELCHGMARLKGAAKSIDLVGLMHMTNQLSHTVDTICSRLNRHAPPTEQIPPIGAALTLVRI